jgi:para-nitrobenzyl esterase
MYHKAIIQSGAPAFRALDDPGRYANEIVAALGSPDGGIEALRAATPEQLVEAAAKVGNIDLLGRDADHPIDGSGDGPHPIVDGVVVTRTFPEALRDKGARNVPLIIGTNEDEGTLFGMLLPKDVPDAELVKTLGPGAADPQAVLDALKAKATGRPPLVDLMTDAVFRIPSLRGADAQAATGVPVWVYLFTWRTPVFGGMLGATHALEIPFVWGMLEEPAWSFLSGGEPPLAIGDVMQDAWLSFARTGRPSAPGAPEWPEYDAGRRPTLELGDEIRVVDDPGRELREAWYRS